MSIGGAREHLVFKVVNDHNQLCVQSIHEAFW